MLERRRETVTAAGELSVEVDQIHLDRLDVADARGRGARRPACVPEPVEIAPTDDYVGSTVVMFRV